MNPENQTPQQTHPYLNNPLQFTIYLPNSNPNSNSNSIPNSNPDSTNNFDPNLISNHLFTLSVPRKRRRGRPRNTTRSDQVYQIPHSFSNPTISLNTGQLPSIASSSAQIIRPHVENSNLLNTDYANNWNLTNLRNNFTNSVLAQNVVPDVSEEIIVINKDATSEALIALTAGFPADHLTSEEIDAGIVSVIGGIEQVNYILIRNHIITKWRENVSNWVTKEMFVDIIPKHCTTLLDSAYNYLLSHGYINFGVAPAIKERIPVESNKSNVVIVGAGLAGLAAARQLMSFGFKVTVLEGRKRAGGRVYTKKMDGGNRSASADLGGSVLTGTLGNPLGILARQLSFSLHKIRDKCPIYSVDGKPVDPDMDQKVESAFNRLLDNASKLRQLMGEVSQDVSLGAALETFRQDGDAVNSEEMNLFNWHLANLEYANAGLVSKLSLAFWDQDDPFDMGGDHCFLSGGNGRLVQALAENLPIVYEKTVHTIRYGCDGVQVIAGEQIFEADMALCTVPLGVLKSASIKFIPELPQRKLDGIKRLGFGLLNKVAMLFPHMFWGTDFDMFGHLCDDPGVRGEFFLFYSYATVAGGPLLIALVAGEAAHKFENMYPTDAVTRVIQILKGIFEPQGIDVPDPIQTVCTRWGSDPFSLGSYSNVAVGSSGDDYDILAESVGDGRLFFAGEATTRRYPATMHGAFLTGLREAANMAHYASVRSLKVKAETNPWKNAHSCASLLADLFREPDLEFGSFSAIFGVKNSDPNSMAVLRVTFSEPQKKSQEGSKLDQQYSNKLLFQQLQSHFNQQQELHVYTLLSRQKVFELREVRGGDEMRLNYLCENLGVNLIGRKGLGSSADSVIASIRAERGNRKSASTPLTRKSGISKLMPVNPKQKLVRKAKVLRKNNSSALHPDVGAKVIENRSGSLPSINVNVGVRVMGSSNGSIPPNSDVKAEAMGNSSAATSSPNLNLVIEGVGDHSVDFPPPNINVGAVVVGSSNGSVPPNSDVKAEAMESSSVATSSPNLNLVNEGLGDHSGSFPQNINVGAIVVGSSNGSIPPNADVKAETMGSSSVSTSSPNLNLVNEGVGDLNSSFPANINVATIAGGSSSGSIPSNINVEAEVPRSSNVSALSPNLNLSINEVGGTNGSSSPQNQNGGSKVVESDFGYTHPENTHEDSIWNLDPLW